ncbi:MAG: MFS transporter [Candidatus Berkelbacteria bacterium]|nr:MFS transporter [Candidatus Berkelbacteria bacterium]
MSTRLTILYVTMLVILRFSMNFINATYVLFLLAHGQNYLDCGLINSIFFATQFVFEIPTGIFADVFGRRNSYLLACFFRVVDPFVYAVSTTFGGFALAEVIAALGRTCENGAFTAWFKDSMIHHGFRDDDDRFLKIFAMANQAGLIAGMLATVIGAYAATLNDSFPWIFSGVAAAINFAFAFSFMKEDYRPKQHSFDWRKKISEGIATMKRSVVYSVKDEKVFFLILAGAALSFAVQGINMQSMPFYKWLLHGNLVYLGWISAAIKISVLVGSGLASYLVLKMKSERGALLLCLLGTGVFIVLSGFVPILGTSLLFFYSHEIFRGAHDPIRLDYLHKDIPSRDRATIDSCSSTSGHLAAVIGLIVSGWLADTFSIGTSWLWSGIILILAVWLLWCWQARKSRIS